MRWNGYDRQLVATSGCDLRGGFSGFFLWIPTRAQPPQCVGCALCRDHDKKGELGTGCGEIVIVRFCDDFVVGFQHRKDAERFYSANH